MKEDKLALPLFLTLEDKQKLSDITAGKTRALAESTLKKKRLMALRARVIIAAGEENTVTKVARRVGKGRSWVYKWIHRFIAEKFAIFEERRHGVPRQSSSSAASLLQGATASGPISAGQAARILGRSRSTAWRQRRSLPGVGKYLMQPSSKVAPAKEGLRDPNLEMRLINLLTTLKIESAVLESYQDQLYSEIVYPILRLKNLPLAGKIKDAPEKGVTSGKVLKNSVPCEFPVKFEGAFFKENFFQPAVKSRHLGLFRTRALQLDSLETILLRAVLSLPGPKKAILRPFMPQLDNCTKPLPASTPTHSKAVLWVAVGEKCFPICWRFIPSDKNCMASWCREILSHFKDRVNGISGLPVANETAIDLDKHLQQVLRAMTRHLGLGSGNFRSESAWAKRKLVSSITWYLCKRLGLFAVIETKCRKRPEPVKRVYRHARSYGGSLQRTPLQ